MTKPVFAGNDCDVGMTMTNKQTGLPISGLTIRRWFSADETHSTGSAAAPIHADLDVNLSEDPPSSGIYPGAIDKLKVNLRLVDPVPNFLGQDIFLHAEDTTAYYGAERCRVYPTRWIL